MKTTTQTRIKFARNARSFTPRVSNWTVLCIVFSLLLWRTLAFGAPESLSQSAQNEIAALLQEKAGRTPAQQKMDSQLVHAAKSGRGQPFAPGATHLKMDVEFGADGRVLVDIEAEVTPALLALIPKGGGQIVNSFAQFHAIRARVTPSQLETLAASQDVRYIRRASKAHLRVRDSEGDTTHLAISARTNFGVNGSGIKVGVLSDSVDYLASLQASNDVGTVTVLSGQSGLGEGNTGEGTAMLEIVHDLAPGASLYFATGTSGEANFANNILSLWSNGCNIICDDVGYFDESPFQDAIVAQAVNTVTLGGAMYFSAAGNAGNLDDHTSSAWQGDFVNGGAAVSPIPEAGSLHSFGTANYNTCINGGGGVALFWSDPLGKSTNDYDLFVLNAGGTSVLFSSTSVQNGTQNPYEYCSVEVNDRVVVLKGTSSAARFLDVIMDNDNLSEFSIATSGTTYGHPDATNAFAVAAMPAASDDGFGAANGPYPNPFTGGAANPFEPFSSDGLCHYFYNANGSEMTPGNLSSTGGSIRQKPDIAAADGVSTDVPGFLPFFGTSAATPHAAAIAALVWSLNPGLSTAQMRSVLTGSALDVNPVGVDRDTGYGVVMANLALAVGATIVTTTNDSVAGSLRRCLATATNGSTITFSTNLSGQTLFLTNGVITLSNNVTIDASALSNGMAINGNHNSSIFTVNSGVTVVLKSLTLTNAYLSSGFGGAIFSEGHLTLNGCKLVNNQCDGTGGALAAAFGTLTMNQTTVSGNVCANNSGLYLQAEVAALADCTISGNSGFNGDAVRVNAAGGNSSLTVINSTFSGNVCDAEAASALTVQSSAGFLASAVMTNCTVASNEVIGMSQPGAIYLQTGGGTNTVALYNTIVSGNLSGLVEGDITGTVVAGSAYNLVGAGGGLVNGSLGNIVGVNNPILAALNNYGGPTQTMPPLFGSPALSAGNTAEASGITTDQRGYPRVSGSHVDIGSVESQIATTKPVLDVLTMSVEGGLAGTNMFEFGFTNVPGTSFTVLATTNLTVPLHLWSILGAPVENPAGSGHFQFADLLDTNYAVRFYDVRSP
jgi:hypothetical protein